LNLSKQLWVKTPLGRCQAGSVPRTRSKSSNGLERCSLPGQGTRRRKRGQARVNPPGCQLRFSPRPATSPLEPT
jgi:hypothetical protein